VGNAKRLQSDLHASGRRFTPEDMLNLHHSNADYIRRKLSEPFNGGKVIVTHHMPHPDCTPPAYAGMKANFLFACDEAAFDEILHSDNAPNLWICGDTHHAFDIRSGRSRIICNPYGYQFEHGRNEFKWDLVIDTNAIVRN